MWRWMIQRLLSRWLNPTFPQWLVNWTILENTQSKYNSGGYRAFCRKRVWWYMEVEWNWTYPILSNNVTAHKTVNETMHKIVIEQYWKLSVKRDNRNLLKVCIDQSLNLEIFLLLIGHLVTWIVFGLSPFSNFVHNDLWVLDTPKVCISCQDVVVVNTLASPKCDFDQDLWSPA